MQYLLVHLPKRCNRSSCINFFLQNIFFLNCTCVHYTFGQLSNLHKRNLYFLHTLMILSRYRLSTFVLVIIEKYKSVVYAITLSVHIIYK